MSKDTTFSTSASTTMEELVNNILGHLREIQQNDCIGSCVFPIEIISEDDTVSNCVLTFDYAATVFTEEEYAEFEIQGATIQ